MSRVHSQWILCLLSALFLLGSVGVISAQIDPDPNSPEPVLFTTKDGRAIANNAPYFIDPSRAQKLETVFKPGSNVVLYASNFAFLPGEGANALRVYALSPKGQQYSFPVTDVTELKRPYGAFAVTIQLNDEVGYFPTPENGDLQLYLTWRGLASNRAVVGYGGNGGWDGRTLETKTQLSNAIAKTSPDTKRSAEYVGYRWSSDRQRFLQQATFGSTPLLDEQVKRLGIRVWLGMQFEEPYPSAANPYPNIPLKNSDANAAIASGGCGPAPLPTTPEYRICIRDHYSMYPVQTWFFREALFGDPQLRHKVAWALSQIWVISGVDTQQSSHMLAYHKILSDNAFGNFRTLMKQMTLNPGMGNYLDMMRSTKNSPNENYPREILQLFTVGLFMLNQDGTVQKDGLGNPVPTYDQDRINNFTKVFTGWRDCRQAPPACPNSVVGTVDYKDPMELVTGNHDLTAKSLFNYPGAPSSAINACAGCNAAAITAYANNSLDQALDNIFNHPNVGPFVSKLLIQHLVESNPTPAYVGRVAAVFNNNGFGVRGDLKAVVRAILLDPEARGDVKTDPNYGKLREPVQLITNVLKNTNAKSFDLTQNSDGSLQPLWGNLTQNPFNSPTVFNYYPADYVIPGTTLLGPEFGIMTTGTAIARANFINTILFSPNSLNVAEDRPLGTKIDITEYQTAAAADVTGNQLVELLNQRLMNNRMSSDMRSKILTAIQAVASSNTLLRAQNAIYLVATSSQFQVQR